MKTKIAIIILLSIMPNCNGASQEAEIPTIRKAAERNGIKYASDDWFLLLAIRKAENGGNGLQFGIMNPKADNLDKQAGWASATIIKHHKRFGSPKVTPEFINSLADRYCPIECDPQGNKNWKKNVRFWFDRWKNE